jgi:hypothetical protein
VFLLWLLIAIFYFIGISDFIAVAMDDDEFEEYLQYSLNLAVSQNRSPDELRDLIVANARELEISVDPVNILIEGERQQIRLTVSYDVIVEFSLLTEAGYRREFEHQKAYRRISSRSGTRT